MDTIVTDIRMENEIRFPCNTKNATEKLEREREKQTENSVSIFNSSASILNNIRFNFWT